MTDFSIRRGSSEDLELIVRVYRESMKSYFEAQLGYWDEEAARKRLLSTDPEDHEIIEVDGEAVGFSLVQTTDEEIHVYRLFLLPSHQGQGIGSAYMRDLCNRADNCRLPIVLRILKVNPAKRLYERFGFVTTDETKSHYNMSRQPVPRNQ